MARREEAEMQLTKVLVVVMILGVGAPLTGCCGGSKTVVTPASTQVTTTLGQELQDLEAARQQGAISDAEYEKAKKKLLEQRAKEK